MHISGTFAEKQDIDVTKQDIDIEKQDIGTPLTAHQQKQFDIIVASFGTETVFGRSDLVAVLDITPSPASALIKKLLEAEKIKTVTGHGKGKYVVKG